VRLVSSRPIEIPVQNFDTNRALETNLAQSRRSPRSRDYNYNLYSVCGAAACCAHGLAMESSVRAGDEVVAVTLTRVRRVSRGPAHSGCACPVRPVAVAIPKRRAEQRRGVRLPPSQGTAEAARGHLTAEVKRACRVAWGEDGRAPGKPVKSLWGRSLPRRQAGWA
jgi:hypothetical protein